MKPRTLALAFVGIAVLAIGGLLVHHASASAGQYATFQPAAEHEWQVGRGLRICATEPPTGSATATAPNAAVSSLTADSEACFAMNPGVLGTWSVSWPVAGPATRSVSFIVTGPADVDWTFYVEFSFWTVILLTAMYRAWWFIAAFTIGAIPHLITAAWPYDQHWILPYLLLGIILEWAAQRFKFNRKATQE